VIINHVCTMNEERATWRYRVAIPAPAIQALGHEVWTDDKPRDGAVNVWHKHGKYLPWDRFEGGVFDVTDDHFNNERREHYIKHCKAARVVTTSSHAMADRIAEETGVDAVYIPDAYEFPHRPHEWHGGQSVMWFGHGSNFDTLRNVQLDCPLEVVTNCTHPGGDGNVRMTPWSHETMLRAFSRHDIVIIPQFMDRAKESAKGNNRAVNALRQGKVVIASDIPSHRELDDYIYIVRGQETFLDGIQWARANPDAAATMVAAGQAYVQRWYSPEEAASRWVEALE